MITTKIEAARGCGYRKPGGIYLVSDGFAASCGKLPIELTVCPCCGAGIKYARGWTWLNNSIMSSQDCKHSGQKSCPACGEAWVQQEYGLIWIGESFYKTPSKFTQEAVMAGISRRIATVPRKFKLGETWVLLAHIKAITNIEDGKPKFTPGIFAAFKPQRIEYIVKGNETDEQIDALKARGFTLVNVIRDIDTQKELKDQLTTYRVKYESETEGVKSIKLIDIVAVSKTKARKKFHDDFKGQIISIN